MIAVCRPGLEAEALLEWSLGVWPEMQELGFLDWDLSVGAKKRLQESLDA